MVTLQPDGDQAASRTGSSEDLECPDLPPGKTRKQFSMTIVQIPMVSMEN